MNWFVYILISWFFWFEIGNAYATPEGDAIREARRATMRTSTRCEYIMKLKDPKLPSVIKSYTLSGNGFFIEHHTSQTNPHYAITATHAVSCPQELDGTFFGENFTINQVASFEIKSRILVRYGKSIYTATIVRSDFNKDPDLDLAILDVLISNGNHGHVSILTDENAYDLKDEVIIFGFMPRGVFRLKVAHIEDILKDEGLLQLNTAGYKGLSGSAVMLYRKGQYSAIGILVKKFQIDDEGVLDYSLATMIKKEYINSLFLDDHKKP